MTSYTTRWSKPGMCRSDACLACSSFGNSAGGAIAYPRRSLVASTATLRRTADPDRVELATSRSGHGSQRHRARSHHTQGAPTALGSLFGPAIGIEPTGRASADATNDLPRVPITLTLATPLGRVELRSLRTGD